MAGTATPELVCRTTTDTVQWVQINGLSGPTDANEGYVNLQDILKLPEASLATEEQIERIVRHDSKGRFRMRTSNGNRQIKATQGHSFNIESPEYTSITDQSQAPLVLHGTNSLNLFSIRLQGLSKRGRTHIHFAPGERNVKSGFPPGCDVAIEIDMARALQDGLKFYKSENDVILSPGNRDGIILPKYFRRVYNIHTGQDV